MGAPPANDGRGHWSPQKALCACRIPPILKRFPDSIFISCNSYGMKAKRSQFAKAGAPAMTDVLGWRRKFGVLGPSTNTIVQPDFEMMRPVGVTNHYSRIFTPNAQAVSNETFMAGTELIGRNVVDAVRSVMTCAPDYLVMGMSAITFYGGAEGADAFQHKIKREAGLGVSIGSHSCTAALKAYGGIRRIAFLSPYYPVANEQVARYFSDSGFAVV